MTTTTLVQDDVATLKSQVATLQQLLQVLEKTSLEQTLKLEEALRRQRAIQEERTRLLESEQKARQETEHARQTQEFLAQAGALLVSSLDHATTLDLIAKMAVPGFADWSQVDLMQADGTLTRVARAHALADRVQLLDELDRNYPPQADEPFGPANVVRTRKAEMAVDISDEMLAASAKDAEHLRILRALELCSYVCAPLLARDRVVGAITFATSRDRRYTEADLGIAQQLADRAALAVDNARLFKQVEEANQRLELRVRERTAELELANRELESFSYSVSHDLRAPIRHISGFADLLKNRLGEIEDAAARRYIINIIEAARNAGTLVDDLLAFSRMGRAELRHTVVNSEGLVREVIRELAPDMTDRRIEWKIGNLPEVRADAAMLRVVWKNLLSNGVKYTRTRDTAIIEVDSERVDKEIRFRVRDNGVGFDSRYQDKLFGVFQRLHRVEEFEGTGIGLANVKRVVTRHGGRAWAESTLGEGATFYFSLPANPK